MTVAEICALLRTHPSPVYRMIQRGEIPSFRAGSEHRFNRKAIQAWQREPEQYTAPPPSERGPKIGPYRLRCPLQS